MRWSCVVTLSKITRFGLIGVDSSSSLPTSRLRHYPSCRYTWEATSWVRGNTTHFEFTDDHNVHRIVHQHPLPHLDGPAQVSRWSKTTAIPASSCEGACACSTARFGQFNSFAHTRSAADAASQFDTALLDAIIDDTRARKVLGYRPKWSNAQQVSLTLHTCHCRL